MQFARINDVTIHYQIIGAPADKPVIVFANSLGTDFRIWRDVDRAAGRRFRDRPLRQARPRAFRCRPGALFDRGSCIRPRRPARSADRSGDAFHLRPFRRRPDRAGALSSSGRTSCARSSFATPPTRSALPKAGTPASPTVETKGIGSIVDARHGALVHARLPPAGKHRLSRLSQHADPPAGRRLCRRPARRSAMPISPKPRRGSPCRRSASSATRTARRRRISCCRPRKLIPDARFEVIRDAGHIPCVEQPEALTAIIRAFIDFALPGEQSP